MQEKGDKMKKIVVSILTVLMLISSLSVSAASFTDVKKGDWFYSQVMTMTEKGLFVGKGNNLFCPNDTMTRAEFITVVVRALYPNADLTLERDQVWWQPIYEVATEKRIITESEFSINSIEQTITRQEMALVSSKALMMRGETFFITEDLHKKIPDYNQVGKEYTMYVEMAYSMGILCGVDDKGTFAPLQTLTRAEAATVLYRIINKGSRNPVDLSSHGSTTTPQTQGAITIHEGQESVRRFAKEGDIVIKADGTQVVLKKGPHGIVGEGQGVAPDLGVKLSENAMYSEVVRAKNSEGGMNFTGATSYKDGSGTPVMNNSYYVNEITGEGHWESEWQAMSSKPTTKGSFHMQLSADKNWIWNGNSGEWNCAYAQNFSDTILQQVLQANGL